MQILVRPVFCVQHTLETILELLIITILLFIPTIFLLTWLRKYQITNTSITQPHDPSGPTTLNRILNPQTLNRVLDALTTVQRVLDHIFSALEELLCCFIWLLERTQMGLRTARIKAETVQGSEGGSEIDLQRVGRAISDLVVTSHLVLMGGVVVFGPLLLGGLVGYWTRDETCICNHEVDFTFQGIGDLMWE
ncbi:hypothetical protein BDV97DRAFT_345900 [Delphinella strobiligena]|nr:hypothetical protein BDV97DRAFT_345900 [Delphinella strobiligena]